MRGLKDFFLLGKLSIEKGPKVAVELFGYPGSPAVINIHMMIMEGKLH
jgi:hypothetical protein